MCAEVAAAAREHKTTDAIISGAAIVLNQLTPSRQATLTAALPLSPLSLHTLSLSLLCAPLSHAHTLLRFMRVRQHCATSISILDLKATTTETESKTEPGQLIDSPANRRVPKFQYPIAAIYHLQFEWAKTTATTTTTGRPFFASWAQKNSAECVCECVCVCVCVCPLCFFLSSRKKTYSNQHSLIAAHSFHSHPAVVH